jgi:hypothetical protein
MSQRMPARMAVSGIGNYEIGAVSVRRLATINPHPQAIGAKTAALILALRDWQQTGQAWIADARIGPAGRLSGGVIRRGRHQVPVRASVSASGNRFSGRASRGQNSAITSQIAVFRSGLVM